MNKSFPIKKHIKISAPTDKVWEALASPKIIKQYMFGAEVVSTWHKGDSVIYKGEWDGQPFEDKGTILEILPEKILQLSFFSASSGLEDCPENRSLITYEIVPEDDGHTTLSITQENNPSQSAADFAGENWEMTLNQIKFILEN
jgi:uncharacterized protein YndB with AHSA1/START domain